MEGIFNCILQFYRNNSTSRRCSKNTGRFPTHGWEIPCPELLQQSMRPGEGFGGGEEDVAP